MGVGGWYPKGIQRLRKSLKDVGYTGDTIFWEGVYPPNSRGHEADPYGFKIHAFEFARKKGYTKILWCDASIWAIKNPNKFFEYITTHGYYTFKTGYNVAQSCSDKALRLAGKTRDEAQQMAEAASGFIGIDFENFIGEMLFHEWLYNYSIGIFHGSRLHDGQSSDPRFLFHRQDQSGWSLAVNRYKANINDSGDWVAYKSHDEYFQNQINHETLTFLINGM